MSLTLGEVGRLIVTFGADRTEFSNDLRATDQEARSVLGGLQTYANTGFTGLKKVVGAGLVGGLGLVAGGFGLLAANMRDSTQLAKEARDAERQLGAVLESTGHAAGLTADQITAMASGLQKVTNFEDDAIVSGQSLLLTFTNIGADTFPRATEAMLDMSQAFGQDLKSSAIQLGKALNDPITGVSALTRVGVSFTEQQKEQIKAMAEAGDVAGAQAIILAELEKQVGGSAKAMADPATQAANAWGDFKEVVGGVTLDLRDKLAAKALPLVNQGIANVTKAIDDLKTNGISLNSVISAVGTVFGKSDEEMAPFIATATSIRDMAVSLWEKITAFLEPVTSLIAQFVSWNDVFTALGVVAAAIVLPILGSIVAAIAPVIAVAALLVGGIALLRNAWENDFGGMRTILTQFWDDKVKPAFENAQTWMAEKLPGAIATLKEFWEEKLLPAIKTVWKFIDENLIPLFKSLAELVSATLNVAFVTLKETFENKIMPALRTVWAFVQDHIIPIFDGMSGSIGGISETIQKAIGWINDLASGLNGVADRIPDLFRPGSPTPFEIGFRGIADAMGEARSAAQGLQSGFGLAAAGVGAGGGDVINIPIQQQFYGQADARTVYRASGAGAMSVQDWRRRRGG